MSKQATVFVTGGASGIGLAIVQAVLGEGWRAVVADLSPGNLDQARDILGAANEMVRFEQLDVSDEEAVTRAIVRCEAEFGPLTGLVNSAGIASDTPALETPTALFRKILEVNLIGSFVACREAARLMRDRGAGSIVNIASVSGIRGSSGRVAYGASKSGMILMTKVMACGVGAIRRSGQCGGAGPGRDAAPQGGAHRAGARGLDQHGSATPLRNPGRTRRRGYFPARRQTLELRDR
jgi:NAD(P)-dependent dehydrogenase (short-subunit alcohol dehydrogenase family)